MPWQFAGMGEIINLRGVRKARAKAEARGQAAANRERFGRTAGQRQGEANAADAARRRLEGARLERPDPEGNAED